MIRHGLALLSALAALLAACSIETKEDSTTGTTIEQATTTAAPEDTTTLPPEEQPPGLADVSVELREVAQYSVDLTLVGTRAGSESIFLGDRVGRVYEIKRDARRNLDTGITSYSLRPQTAPFLDISGQVLADAPEQGLHGFAFSSDGNRLYVSYTNQDGNTAVAELRVSGGRVSPTSQRELLIIEQPGETQTAGPLLVGPDGFLYVTLGDGGGRGDPFGHGQNPETWLGSVLRIDPESGEGVPYNIPQGNPYNGEDGAKEVQLIGVRDPAAITYDVATRDLWVADIGQDGRQEINLLEWEGEPIRGGNLGWSIMNGIEPLGSAEPPEDHIGPVFEYGPEAGCGVVGGAVYRAGSIPGLDGAYVFGDRCSGKILAIKVVEGEEDEEDEEGVVVEGVTLPIQVEADTLSAIGTDPTGELVVVTSAGLVYQVDHVEPPEPPPAG